MKLPKIWDNKQGEQEEIDKLNINDMDDGEVLEYIRKKVLNTLTENGNKQKVISLQEVENFIENGWEYVNSLPDDRAIMRLP